VRLTLPSRQRKRAGAPRAAASLRPGPCPCRRGTQQKTKEPSIRRWPVRADPLSTALTASSRRPWPRLPLSCPTRHAQHRRGVWHLPFWIPASTSSFWSCAGIPGLAQLGPRRPTFSGSFRKGLPTEECLAIEKTQKRKGAQTGPGSWSPDTHHQQNLSDDVRLTERSYSKGVREPRGIFGGVSVWRGWGVLACRVTSSRLPAAFAGVQDNVREKAALTFLRLQFASQKFG
jgi:hypothetical protein